MPGHRRCEGSIIKHCHGDGRIDGKDDMLHALQEVHQRGATTCVCCVEEQNACRFSFYTLLIMQFSFSFMLPLIMLKGSFFAEELMYTSENDAL